MGFRSSTLNAGRQETLYESRYTILDSPKGSNSRGRDLAYRLSVADLSILSIYQSGEVG